MMVPFIFAENPFTAIETQFSKAAGGHESLFVAAIDVSPSLGRRLAMGKERGQQLAPFVEDAQGRRDVTNLPSSSLCSAIRQLHFSGSNPGRKGTSVSCRQSVIISRRTERPSSLRMGATRKRFDASRSRSGMRRRMRWNWLRWYPMKSAVVRAGQEFARLKLLAPAELFRQELSFVCQQRLSTFFHRPGLSLPSEPERRSQCRWRRIRACSPARVASWPAVPAIVLDCDAESARGSDRSRYCAASRRSSPLEGRSRHC